jgi:hypothetical protein
MKKMRTLLLSTLLLAPLSGVSAADGLTVYPPVKDPNGSTHCESRQYKVRVREDRPGSPWKDAYAMRTISKTAQPGQSNKAYFQHLAGWTHTYVNFETTTDVIVEITDAVGYKIESAVVHPQEKGSATVDKLGRAYVNLKKDSLVAVDIDGQMDKQDTGMGYKGDAIHTISIFANPPLVGKPDPNGPGVRFVKAGEKPPTDGDWTTLYFGPGVHRIGLGYKVRKNCQYYIPGDAIVYGTFNTGRDPNGEAIWTNGENVRIFGHGTLSGAKLTHPDYTTPKETEEKRRVLYRPIEVNGATNTTVEGITIVDAAFHSIMMPGGSDQKPNTVKWAKMINWRANGDGINPFDNGKVENCFIRTQDDALIVRGKGISDTVIWNDANGTAFVMDQLQAQKGGGIEVKNCSVIYSRAVWNEWGGGRVFGLRGDGEGEAGAKVVFRDIKIEDPRPTLQSFFLCTEVPEPYVKPAQRRGPGEVSGVLFENVSIAKPSVRGEPELIWAYQGAKITNFTFKNVTLDGKPMALSDFKVNEFVESFTFNR